MAIKSVAYLPIRMLAAVSVVYVVLTSLLLTGVVIAYYLFLKRPFGPQLVRARWAGLNSLCLWVPWFFSFLFWITSYGLFFSYFLILADCAENHTMYHPICILSLFFLLASALFPYLLLRAENYGTLLTDGVMAEWAEVCLTCTCCVFTDVSAKRAVIMCMASSASATIAMLVLYCVGIDWQRERTAGLCNENAVLVAVSLAWIAFICTFVDLVFWGYTWFNGHVSEGCDCCGRVESVPLVGDGDGSSANSSSSAFQWSNIRLLDHVEIRAPLLPRGIAGLDERGS